MNRPTHVFVGLTWGLLVGGSDPLVFIPSSIMGGLGGYFPDFDLRFRHRKLLHNIFVMILTSLIVYVSIRYVVIEYYGVIGEGVILRITLGFLGGYLLHLLLDSLTKMGVYILYPLSRWRLRIPLFRSNSLWANGLGFMIGGIMFYLWVKEIRIIEYIENLISSFL